MRATKLAVFIPSLVLVLTATSALATTQFWSPTGTIGSTGGLWDTTTANWNTSFTSGGGTTWVQGNDASFTIVGTVSVTVNTTITVGNVTFIGAAGTATVLQSTTGSKQLSFPAGSFTIDTANRTILWIPSAGTWDFIGTATTVLTKKGTGTMSLSSMAGTYGGKWVIAEGWLSIGTTSSLQWFGGNTADDAVTLNTTSAGGITCSGGIRTISGNGIIVGANGGAIRAGTTAAVSIDVKSKITGSGVLSCNTAGTTVAANLLILDNAANTFNGTYAISSAITRLGLAGAMQSGASVVMNTGGTTTTLDFNGKNTTIKTISGTGGTVDLNGAAVTLDNPAGEVFAPATAVKSTIVGGSFVKNGSGAITFSISSGTYDGGVTVNNGTLKIGTNPSLGTGKLTMAGGKLSGSSTTARAPANAVDITGDCTFGDSVNTGTLTFGTGAWRLVGGDRQITVDTTTLTINGTAVLGNDGTTRALTKAGSGTLTLGTASTYGGDTAISGGKLALSGSGSVNSPNISVSGGAIFDVSGVTGGTYSLAAGQTLKGNGTVNGTVAVTGSATVAPGASIGTLTFNNSPTLSGAAVMEIDKGAAPNADKLVVSGNPLVFGGTLTVNNIGSALTGGETFDLFDATGLSGTFSSLTLPGSLAAGLNWYTGNLNVNGTITVNRAPTAADKTYTRESGVSLKILKSDLLVGASDLDSGDSVTYDALPGTGSQGATVTQDATTIYYDPANDNSDTLQYRVKDTREGTTTKNIQINVVSGTGQGTTITVSGSTATVSFAGIPGRSYQVQRSTDLMVWVTLDTITAPANSGLFQYVDNFSDLGSPPPTAYYRLALP